MPIYHCPFQASTEEKTKWHKSVQTKYSLARHGIHKSRKKRLFDSLALTEFHLNLEKYEIYDIIQNLFSGETKLFLRRRFSLYM